MNSIHIPGIGEVYEGQILVNSGGRLLLVAPPEPVYLDLSPPELDNTIVVLMGAISYLIMILVIAL